MLENLPYVKHTDSGQFFLIAGPCVVEDEALCFQVAERIAEVCNKLEIPYIFKASYRKANRSRSDSFTGIGDLAALDILRYFGPRQTFYPKWIFLPVFAPNPQLPMPQ